MGRNVGTVDQVFRVLLGAVLLMLVFVGPQSRWGYLGLILILTGFMGSCPLYALLGLSSVGGLHRVKATAA